MTDLTIKNAKPKDKEYFLTDGNGLRVRIAPGGSKIFQMRYSYLGKRKIVTIGAYPLISLLEARNITFEYSKLLEQGIDPQSHKKEEGEKLLSQNKSQLHLIIQDWYEIKKENIAPTTARKIETMLRLYLLPHFCKYDKDRKIVSSANIATITHGQIADILSKLHIRSQGNAKTLSESCFQIWQYALSFGFVENNIMHKIDRKSVTPKKEARHYAKITDEKILGEMLRAIDSYKHSSLIRCALQFVALVPLRAENLSRLKWKYIDFEKQILTIPRTEMKVKNKNSPDFTLPLSKQAIAVLKEIKPFTEWGEWVFHGKVAIHKPLVYESLNKALRSMGFADEARGRKQTLHSFRGTFRSLCDTHQAEHNVAFEIKEAVLDHRVGDNVTLAYSHKADYTEQMRPLLQWWADFLDRIRQG